MRISSLRLVNVSVNLGLLIISVTVYLIDYTTCFGDHITNRSIYRNRWFDIERDNNNWSILKFPATRVLSPRQATSSHLARHADISHNNWNKLKSSSWKARWKSNIKSGVLFHCKDIEVEQRVRYAQFVFTGTVERLVYSKPRKRIQLQRRRNIASSRRYRTITLHRSHLYKGVIQVRRVIKGLSSSLSGAKVVIEGFGDSHICQNQVKVKDTRIFLVNNVNDLGHFRLNSSLVKVTLKNILRIEEAVKYKENTAKIDRADSHIYNQGIQKDEKLFDHHWMVLKFVEHDLTNLASLMRQFVY
ncbi:hypothetical protein CHUAL_000872 [Chamberlinius hualienensis]